METTSVAELRKRFGGQSKGQTPANFAALQAPKPKLTKSQADAMHNVVAGLSESELNRLVKQTSHPNDPLLALRDILDFDVVTGDAEIDSLLIAELLARLPGSDGLLYRVGDMRTRLLSHAAATTTTTPAASSELAQALSTGTELDINRAILKMFFKEFDPSKLGEIDSLLAQYKGCEEDLFADIAWNYPDHANRLVTFSIYASYEADDEHTSEEEEEEEENRPSVRRPSYVLAKLM
ncbi:hypothetical protein BASA81_001817 [Batrachochytrium salamandrivorans]|nr:hypothetical protein BASA81_001817 [Batrachochytrium salamandrivorans]